MRPLAVFNGAGAGDTPFGAWQRGLRERMILFCMMPVNMHIEALVGFLRAIARGFGYLFGERHFYLNRRPSCETARRCAD